MKRVRFYNILGLLCNMAIIILFALSCVAISQYMGTHQEAESLNNFARYDVLSSILAVVAAFFMIIANVVSIKRGKTSIPKLFSFLLFFAAAFSCIGFILNVCFPTYNGIDSIQQMFSTEAGFLYFAFIIPLIVIFEFLFISIDKNIKFLSIFFPFVGTLLYVIGIIIAMAITQSDLGLKYRFFHIFPWIQLQEGETIAKNAVILGFFIIASFGLSLVMWIINRINHAIIFGVSIQEIEQPKTKNKSNEPKSKQFTDYIKNTISFNSDENTGVVYHISYHNRKLKTWKVKTEEAGRALKVFKTQKDAIQYAKFMVAKKGGSIRIHSMIGRIRKDW